MGPQPAKGNKRRRPCAAPSPAIACPPDVVKALRQGVHSSHRTLCVVLSNDPQDALVELLKTWKAVGGKGRPVVVGESQALTKLHQSPVRCISWSAVGEEGDVVPKLLGVAIVTQPDKLSPRSFAVLCDSLQGGGLLVLVLPEIAAWDELHRGHQGPSLLFERLLCRVPDCRSALVLDCHLSPMPYSTALTRHNDHQDDRQHTHDAGNDDADMNLEELRASLAETPIVGRLVALAATVDQARVLLSFFEPASEKSMSGTIAVNGPPGRGKSAAIGLCFAGAVAYGYSNVFFTSTTPSSAQAIFRYTLKGFDALGYQESKDYELIQGTEASAGCVLRINIFREHRQTIQYVFPHDHAKLQQAEVVAIDDAASLEPQVFRRLLGPYLMLIVSNVGGVGGAGPSAAARLMDVVKTHSLARATDVAAAAAAEVKGADRRKGERQVHEERWKKAAEAVSAIGAGDRSLVEVQAEVPVHYAAKDPLQRWITKTLALGRETYGLRYGTPAPWDCELWYLERGALLSAHASTEQFLSRLLYVYGAYDRRRDPDLFSRLAEPSSHVLVLLGPDAEDQGDDGGLPDILALVHVRVVSNYDAANVLMLEPDRDGGDVNAEASVEVLHIATHPDVTRMGYGSRTLGLVMRWLRGDIVGGVDDAQNGRADADMLVHGSTTVAPITRPPRPPASVPPLLTPLEEKGPLNDRPSTAWVRSVDAEPWLLRMWTRGGFRVVDLKEPEEPGLSARVTLAQDLGPVRRVRGLCQDFCRRAMRLMPTQFSALPVHVALELVRGGSRDGERVLTAEEQGFHFSAHDMKRLEMYARSLVDHTVVSDLLPLVAQLFFLGRLPDLTPAALPDLQARALLGLAMQRKTTATLSYELMLPAHQVLALFNKALRRLVGCLRGIQEAEVEAEMDAQRQRAESAITGAGGMASLPVRLDEEMEVNAQESMADLRSQQKDLLKSLDVMRYAVKGSQEEWEEVLRETKQKGLGSGMLQIRSAKPVSRSVPPLGVDDMKKRKRSRGDDSDDEGIGRLKGAKRKGGKSGSKPRKVGR